MNNPPATPSMASLALRPPEAAKALGVSERTLYSLVKSRGLPCLRLKRARLFPVAELQRWLSEQSQAQAAAERAANE